MRGVLKSFIALVRSLGAGRRVGGPHPRRVGAPPPPLGLSPLQASTHGRPSTSQRSASYWPWA